MGNLTRSRDDMIRLAQTYGAWRRGLATKSGTTTAANSTCGRISLKRFPDVLTVPTLGAGVTAAYFTEILMTCAGAGTISIAGHETLLGTLAVSTNTFTAGSAMPTKTIEGSSVVTASLIPMVIVSTTLTATTPVLTITYVNESGTTGRTCSMTLPTSPAITTGFLMTPHLESGDTGVREVTNISISTGSAGQLKIYGVLPQSASVNSGAASGMNLTALTAPLPLVPFDSGDSLAAYQFGLTGPTDLHLYACAIGDD